jgi:hypothetical protein
LQCEVIMPHAFERVVDEALIVSLYQMEKRERLQFGPPRFCEALPKEAKSRRSSYSLCGNADFRQLSHRGLNRFSRIFIVFQFPVQERFVCAQVEVAVTR